jgi:hypothetical protein
MEKRQKEGIEEHRPALSCSRKSAKKMQGCYGQTLEGTYAVTGPVLALCRNVR